MLNDVIPYSDGGEGTLYEHIINAIVYAGNDTGKHGLCLMRDGDWTDPMNGIGRLGIGESTWTTLAVIYGAQLTVELCETIGDVESKEKLEAIISRLEKAVNDSCWDESAGYYFGGWHDDGKPFEIFLRSDMGRGMLISTKDIELKATRGASGKQIMQLSKKNAKVELATDRIAFLGADVTKFRKHSLPSTGSVVNQISFNF